jgi:hypothetical protein
MLAVIPSNGSVGSGISSSGQGSRLDLRRTTIPLLGGDKRGRWNEWYEQMIPQADQLYDGYLAELRREGKLT